MIKSTGPKSSNTVKEVMNQVSSIVESTYGPFGGFVILSDGEKSVITKDGVSVVRSLVATEPAEMAIIDVIKEAANNTLAKAGDGTTTTIVMASKILSVFHKTDFLNKDNILKKIKENIKSKSKQIDVNSNDLIVVAETATAGDKELSSVIVDAFIEAQKNGISGVIAEPKIGSNTKLEVVDGISFTANMIDNIFYDNHDLKTKELKDVNVLVSSSEISGEDGIVELITTCVNNGIEKIVLIAPSFAMTSLSALSINHKVSIDVTAMVINGGNFVNTKMAIDTFAESIGAFVIGEESGVEIGDVKIDMMPKVEKFSVTGKSVVISGYDNGDKVKISQLVNNYTSKLRIVSSDEERDMFKSLISILKKKMIKVIVGGNTVNSITEKKDRADDCINSVELALKGGVVPGSGSAYVNMASGTGCRTDIDGAVDKVFILINGGNVNGSSDYTLDPTIVAETVAEQAIELAFILGMTNSVVLTK